MGDGGQMYPTYTAELCEAMGALADGADVLLPNLTEASILTGRDYPGQNLEDAEVTDWLDALLKLGAKNVVLKGIDRGDGFLRNYVASAETGAERKQEHAHEKLPYMIHGTGDAFASALCGAVMAGKGLSEAAAIAGEFVRDAMVSTRNQPDFVDRGVSFELILGAMTARLHCAAAFGGRLPTYGVPARNMRRSAQGRRMYCLNLSTTRPKPPAAVTSPRAASPADGSLVH